MVEIGLLGKSAPAFKDLLRFNAIQIKNATFPNIQLSMHANCLRASAKNVRALALALGMAKNNCNPQ